MSDLGPLLFLAPQVNTHVRRFIRALSGGGWPGVFVPVDGSAMGGLPELTNEGWEIIDWTPSLRAPPAERIDESFDLILEVFRALRPSLVLAGPIHTVGAVAASKLRGAPVVQMSHGSDLLLNAQDSAEVIQFALTSATGVFVDTVAGATVAARLGAGVDRTWVMPWGVDLDAFQCLPWPEDSDIVRALSLRSLEDIYDPVTVLRGFAAARRLSPVPIELTVAGDGSLAPYLRRVASEIGVADFVRWVGRVPEEDLPSLFTSHHVHVSASRSDGCSVSQLQAFAMGRPSLATDIPGNREWITDGLNGHLFPAGDSDGFGRRLAACAQDLSALRAKGLAARERVERDADWKRNVRQWIMWLRRIAETQSSDP